MEAGILLRPIWSLPKQPLRFHRGTPPNFPRFVKASLNSLPPANDAGVPKPTRNLLADWVANNDDLARSLPIYVGGFSLLAVLLNRAVSGIAPVADASRSLVIVYDGICVLQVGVAAESSSGDVAETVDASKLIQGALYTGLMKSGAQSYLANLSLYPGKAELPFLPPNTQAVILQPLGDKGIAVIGGDTIRGFTTADQAWISLIGDKLDATLMKSLTKTEFLTQNTG